MRCRPGGRAAGPCAFSTIAIATHTPRLRIRPAGPAPGRQDRPEGGAEHPRRRDGTGRGGGGEVQAGAPRPRTKARGRPRSPKSRNCFMESGDGEKRA